MCRPSAEVANDVEWLASNNLMDYSLVLSHDTFALSKCGTATSGPCTGASAASFQKPQSSHLFEYVTMLLVYRVR